MSDLTCVIQKLVTNTKKKCNLNFLTSDLTCVTDELLFKRDELLSLKKKKRY